jgi:hypothetical protein
MRTHGEPNMPEPNFHGRHISITVTPGSGVNPGSPQFAAATAACKHLLPTAATSTGNEITAADQADYLKAAECMRAHGIHDFPDPTFPDDRVAFNTRLAINTNSPQYKRALATCEQLIPAGLPYSSTGGT